MVMVLLEVVVGLVILLVWICGFGLSVDFISYVDLLAFGCGSYVGMLLCWLDCGLVCLCFLVGLFGFDISFGFVGIAGSLYLCCVTGFCG